MKIIIDAREKQLFKAIQVLQKTNIKLMIDVYVQNLPLGDAIICDDDTELIIFERKSLSDLAASIPDGRYKEQSFRLHHTPIHNHNIIYIVEGIMNNYIPQYKTINSSTLYSAMCTIHYYKGFSVFRTFDIMETADYILHTGCKLIREKETKGFYNGGLIQPTDVYSSVVKRVKKQNLNPENIGEVILSQIPGISTANSLAIMNKFGSLYKLMFALKEDQNCLQHITYTTKTGKNRRVSQKCIESVINYLLYQKETVITVDTET